jgi:hypothetical protein
VTGTTETVVIIDHDGIFPALLAFQAEVGNVSKDKENTFFKSNYADLAAVKDEAQPFLTKFGLAVVQKPSFLVVEETVYDTLVTKVVHAKSGEFEESTMILKPIKSDPQAQGSAITYARRYAFMAVLGLVADDDDDGNAASAPAPKFTAPTELQLAVRRVQAAVKGAGVSPADATGYFKVTHGEESLVKSTNIKALNDTADHYEVVAAERQE